MIFSDRTYSVLVVSHVQKLNEVFTQMLPPSIFYPIRFQPNAGAARRELMNRSYDIVIINAPLPDDTGSKLALDALEQNGTVVLTMVAAEQLNTSREALSGSGVFTLSKPFSRSSLEQSLNWLCTARERIRHLESKTTTMESKMEEIRLVNRAKCLLIEQLKMTEASAHRHIEKQAMDRCLSRREVALGIIHTYG